MRPRIIRAIAAYNGGKVAIIPEDYSSEAHAVDAFVKTELTMAVRGVYLFLPRGAYLELEEQKGPPLWTFRGLRLPINAKEELS